MKSLAWLGLRVKREDLLRVLVLFAVCLGIGLLVVDYGGSTTERLEVGDIATRTVKAPRSFTFRDTLERASRQEAARAAVLPVYVYQADQVDERAAAIASAFGTAREDLVAAFADIDEDPEEARVRDLPRSVRSAIRETFRDRLGASVPDADVDALMEAGFPAEAQALATRLLRQEGARLIIADREQLPSDRGALTVVDVGVDAPGERTLRDLGTVALPDEVRRDLEMRGAVIKYNAPWVDAAARVAMALVAPNLRASPDITEARRVEAAAAVPPVEVYVKRGSVLFRDGEELSEEQLARYRAFQASSGPALGLEIASVFFFVALLVFTVVQFGRSNLRRFSLSLRDVTAVGLLVLLTAVLARAGVGISSVVAALAGYEAEPRSFWFAVPIAAAPMLVRLLVGVNWALVTGLVVSAVCGLFMDLDALMVLFAVLSSIVAAGAVNHTRERLSILRAGALVGVANAAAALLVHFLAFFMGEGEVLAAVSLRPLWAMGFAFLGGLLSSFLVLGLMPAFERAGFVTDYRLMELANLNHPLMRQLMLRAPGSYHHSVVVGSLSEAACEAIGANALQTRVAAYFHDIGKSLKPQYFVENQGSGGNKHNGLDPYTSAAIIISHVTDGVALAHKHRLPKPCVDNILMHHGTGLLQYFYAKAVSEAGGDASQVDESAFRYPGPRPDSKESGILMLADKVEAATRTIKEPTEEKFRSMVHNILNSIMADNQFEDCPLTFQELYAITDAMVGVLVGIHHQRIEYPQTAHLSGVAPKDVPPPPARKADDGSIITLEIPSQAQLRSPSPMPARHARLEGRRDQGGQDLPPDPDTDETTFGDYEAVEHLPGGGS